jgi:cytidine deaminase
MSDIHTPTVKVADLFAAAIGASAHAYAPYSGFAVGAAASTADGRIFAAANMENASYGLSVCAEVGALHAAAGACALGLVTQIAIVGGPVGQPTTGQIVTPCGRCRQLILESAQLGAYDIVVHCADTALSVMDHFLISKLLPHAFGPANLR